MVASIPSSILRLVFDTGSRVDKLIGRLTMELIEGRGDDELGGIGHRGRSALNGQTLSAEVDQVRERLQQKNHYILI
jgi:hypothetical protein